MRSEADLLRAMAEAKTQGEQEKLSAELDRLRAQRRARVSQDREIDLGSAVVKNTLTPVQTFAYTTEATDWLLEIPTSVDSQYDHRMRAEATLWFDKVSPEVKADRDEFAQQAMGQAQMLSGQFGIDADAARHAYLTHVARLYKQASKTSSEGQEEAVNCATCGDSIERDPEGEEPRTWHHTSGGSHDHEAEPSSDKESSRRTANTDFDSWMEKVDQAVQSKVGLSVYDLADIDFYGLWESGASPSAAARKALSNEGFYGKQAETHDGDSLDTHTDGEKDLGDDAADVADVPTPGQEVADYPVPETVTPEGKRKTAAPSDGQTSYCRICGVAMEGQDYAWYALKASSPQRNVGEHVHIPARLTGRAGEFGPDGVLVPGTPGGGEGQYDAPAGTIFDGAANPIPVTAKRKTAGVVVKVMYLDGRNESSTFDTEEEADAFIEGLEDYILVSTTRSTESRRKTAADMVTDAELAPLEAEWREAFDALRAAGLEADADDPIAQRYRDASQAVNHAHRSRDWAIATGQPTASRKTAQWSAGHNMAGYMPESEPYVTDDWDGARNALIDDIERAADHMYDSYPDLVDQYDAAIQDLKSLSPGSEWSDILPSSDSQWDLGISYWLNKGDFGFESSRKTAVLWPHNIFTCPSCGYSTNDTYTAGTINDLLVSCPSCNVELIPGDERAWCNLRHPDCGWYNEGYYGKRKTAWIEDDGWTLEISSGIEHYTKRFGDTTATITKEPGRSTIDIEIWDGEWSVDGSRSFSVNGDVFDARDKVNQLIEARTGRKTANMAVKCLTCGTEFFTRNQFKMACPNCGEENNLANSGLMFGEGRKTVAKRKTADDRASDQAVDHDQAGTAESTVTDYDAEDEDPFLFEDWDGEDDTGSLIGSEVPSEYPGAEGSNVDSESLDDLTSSKVSGTHVYPAQWHVIDSNTNETWFEMDTEAEANAIIEKLRQQGTDVSSLYTMRFQMLRETGKTAYTSDEDGGYQGWANGETWSVALWFNNEYDHYQATRGMTSASEIEAYARANYPISFTWAGDGGFDWSVVNWDELIEDIQSE